MIPIFDKYTFPMYAQVRMAQIFQDVFGPKLLKENLVEKEGLDRLPSPHLLQGMIILKGTEKDKKDSKLTVRRCTFSTISFKFLS